MGLGDIRRESLGWNHFYLGPVSQKSRNFSGQGPVSRKSRELFGPEKVVVKLQSACFEKLIFLHVFNIRKTKRIAKFDGLEPRRCEDVKGIVAPEIDPKSFGAFEKRAPVSDASIPVVCSPRF